MANIKSNKKRAKTNEKKRQHNVAYRSMVKTASKKVLSSLNENDAEATKKLLRDAESLIARAHTKGIFKKNTASRKVSVLARAVAKATQLSSAA